MPETGFGGVDVTTSFTDRYVFSDGIPMPTGRAMANGSRACLITTVRAFIAGRGGSRTYNIQLGPSETGNRGVGSAGSAVNTGWQGLSGAFLAQGGSTRMTLNFSGSSYFGRAGGGQGTDSYGRNFGTLGGGYLWAQAPSNPNFVGVYDDAPVGAIRTDFRGAEDDGGAGIFTYRLQWATDPGFTQNLQQYDTGSGQINAYGCQPGLRYYFRSAARNAVTEAAGTFGPWSNVVSTIAGGAPSAPRNFRATNSSTAFNTVTFQWDPPADTAGGITEYWVGNSSDTIGTTTGATSLTVKVPSNNTNNYSVRARNAWAVRRGVFSPYSNTITHTSTDFPSEPRNVTAVASSSIAGQITVNWQPPAVEGTGGVLRYSLYDSTNKLINANIPATTRSYNVTGLTPGTYYAFYLVAWNAIANSVGTPSRKSNTAGDTSQGQPNQPYNLKLTRSTTVAGRLILTWDMTGNYTGFNVYERVDGVDQFAVSVKTNQYIIDGAPTSGARTFSISARNAVTDATTPVSEGPRSDLVSGTPGTSTTQTVATTGSTSSNITNVELNGRYQITGYTSNSFSFLLAGPNFSVINVPAGSGSVSNETSTGLNGTKTIVSTPTPTSFVYYATGTTVPVTPVAGGAVINLTNQAFNVPANAPVAVTAVNNTDFTVSYQRAGAANVASTVTTGTILNKSNSVFNGTYPLGSVPSPQTLQFFKSGAGTLAESGATGTVTDNSNISVYNYSRGLKGAATIIDTPTYNTFTYTSSSAGGDLASTPVDAPYGQASRSASKATLNIKYRSGWAG